MQLNLLRKSVLPQRQAGQSAGIPGSTPSACCRLTSTVLRASKQDAIQEMQRFKSGLAGTLNSKEKEWHQEAQAKNKASRWRLGAAAAQASSAGSLQELNKDTFQPFIDEAGDKLVIVDFYTDWCGPCKVMLPLLVQMAGELQDQVSMVKFNCNKENKELGKTLGIRVAPTFHLYKKGEKVAELTGAKVDELRALIDKFK